VTGKRFASFRIGMRLFVLLGAGFVLATAAAAQPPGWVERRHPDFGWRMSHPHRFAAADFTVQHRVTWRGTTIANFGPPEVHGSPQELADFPTNGVVVRFFHRVGGPAPKWDARDSRFPLSLERFRRPDGPWRHLPFQAGGIQFEALAWIGPAAASRDVEALRQIVRSFRPASLRTGSVSGCRFYVLEYARAYPVRSVRRYVSRDLPPSDCMRRFPFFLVHGSDGYYTVSWSRRRVGCSVRFDPRRRQFFCPNGARWDLRGRMLGNANDRLNVRRAVIAFDGHILVLP
jgi:hypothetical protein